MRRRLIAALTVALLGVVAAPAVAAPAEPPAAPSPAAADSLTRPRSARLLDSEAPPPPEPERWQYVAGVLVIGLAFWWMQRRRR